MLPRRAHGCGGSGDVRVLLLPLTAGAVQLAAIGGVNPVTPQQRLANTAARTTSLARTLAMAALRVPVLRCRPGGVHGIHRRHAGVWTTLLSPQIIERQGTQQRHVPENMSVSGFECANMARAKPYSSEHIGCREI